MDSSYEVCQTSDGSATLISSFYGQAYHSQKDGAWNETLYKHIVPIFSHHRDKSHIALLDICFGLGYNTLMTLWYNDTVAHKHVTLYSVEMDEALLDSLKTFLYPEAFAPYMQILHTLIESGSYVDESYTLTLYRGDARDFIPTLPNAIDGVYQDPFSPDVNPLLWSVEYFADIARAMRDDALLTTYSVALRSRLALYANGLLPHLAHNAFCRDFTVASKSTLEEYTLVDMEHKIATNPTVKPIYDADCSTL